jgi:SP family general alpha glucoside:H+ symporter-like MFS transporter
MATIVPTDRELKVIDLSSSETQDLIRQAEANDAADRALTVMQALKKYKKAVFWAMLLSTSLIMEGYDVVIVCHYHSYDVFDLATDTNVT